MYATIGGGGKKRNVSLDYALDTDGISRILEKMCDGSLYAYSESITKGYVSLKNGIRVGVCGTADVENGINDVDDFITGYVRTDKASISFNGAWAQNIKQREMFIDFMGDKGGARLEYGGKFEFTDASTLETSTPEYDIPNMYLKENEAFVESIEKGTKPKNHIDNILESMKLLDALYESASIGKEVKFE